MAPGEADTVSLSGDQSAAKEGAPACQQSRQAHPRTHPSRSARTTTSPKSEASSPSARPLASTRLAAERAEYRIPDPPDPRQLQGDVGVGRLRPESCRSRPGLFPPDQT